MRQSVFFVPTLREAPAEADVASHALMLRGGYLRRVAAGIYSLLPLGVRVIRNVSRIVREEMDRAGAQEVSLPGVQPSELWMESGRWQKYGKELLRLKDRHEREFCLGPTHEEVITDLVRRDIQSYRQLPVNLYQIQPKFRDEIRPRFGLMRAREFLMKDAYSFDADALGAAKSYEKMFKAYTKIFERCGLVFKAVEADTGQIGGTSSHEFMVLADTGEDAIATCASCTYAANVEMARTADPEEAVRSGVPELERVSTPGKKTVEEVSSFLRVKPRDLIKTLIYQADRRIVAVLVRGDHEVNEIKLRKALDAGDLQLAPAQAVESLTRAPSGFAGPVGLGETTILADTALKGMAEAVVGANSADAHLLHVVPGRDFLIETYLDLRNVTEEDPCPKCGSRIEIRRGIEVGHVFLLGTKYSETMGANFLDKDGAKKPFVMGCFGIGIGRTAAAAVEQNHDEKGIRWPDAIAPFQVHILPMNVNSERVMITSELIYGTLMTAGVEVLLDDRDERAGVKFNDADLIGIPVQVVVGDKNLAEGLVEWKERRTNKVEKVSTEKIIDLLKQRFSPGRPAPLF